MHDADEEKRRLEAEQREAERKQAEEDAKSPEQRAAEAKLRAEQEEILRYRTEFFERHYARMDPAAVDPETGKVPPGKGGHPNAPPVYDKKTGYPLNKAARAELAAVESGKLKPSYEFKNIAYLRKKVKDRRW